ncbi:hypothetical protein C8R45DRAFT_1014967 [Mycena sanguinolenta]|nr:hypothetical protein C8R45DRAFT_1014967 [Mycena sanguinolenta]
MHSFTASLIAAVLFAATVVKGDFVAFSGETCDGDEGNNVPCDGSCHSFDGRHSFEVVADGTHCVAMFEDDGCVGQIFEFGVEPEGECINVNTGTPIGSFTCSASSTCVLAEADSITNAT